MPARAVVARGLAAAIVIQLTIAGLVVASGGAVREAAAGLERAEILDTVGLVERDVLTTAGAGDPVELAAAAPAPVPPITAAPTTSTPPPTTAPPATAPPATAPPATAPPTTAPPAPAAPPSTAAPAPAPQPAPSETTTAGSWRDGQCEASMLQWMNEARAGAGRAPLADDPVVDHVAFDWSDHLAGTGELAHNPSYGDQVFAARPEAMTAGEVVGTGHEPRAVFDEFLRSPTHRDAILRAAFDHATAGCVRDADGRVWVTVNFWG